MKKGLYLGLMLMAVGCFSTTMFAKTEAELVDDVVTITNSGVSWDSNNGDVPTIKVAIKDAYKRAGKTEKMIIELEGAYWTQGPNSDFRFDELNGIHSGDIAVRALNSVSVQLNIDIPSNITSGNEVSFQMPLWITSKEDIEKVEVIIRPGDDSQIIEGTKVLVGADYNKSLTYQLGDIPELKQNQGVMADVVLTELGGQAVGGRDVILQMNLENSDYVFGDFDYFTKSDHDDDIDYLLKSDKYIILSDGFKDTKPTISLNRPRKTERELIFKLKDLNSSDPGKITFTNIPIFSKNGKSELGDIKVTLTSDSVIDLPQEMVVAKMVEKTSEEIAEEELQEMVEVERQELEKKEQEELEEQKVLQEAQKVEFELGKTYFTKGGVTYKMDVAPYADSKGSIMVPLRYLAVGLGMNEGAIRYDSGVVYLDYKGRSVELTIGSTTAMVNGVPIELQVPITVVGTRSYAPIGEIAKILGVNKAWDNQRKVATFY